MSAGPDVPKEVVREYIRPAIRAVPSAMARPMGMCVFSLVGQLADGEVTSRWTTAGEQHQIALTTGGRDPHDIAMELLACLGQILWETLGREQLRVYGRLLRAELEAGVEGEIDEEALAEKQLLFRDRASARSQSHLERYARASFSETAAEYVHCLWHDVHLVRGAEHLPARQLRRRLELFCRWFPPDCGYQLFSASRS